MIRIALPMMLVASWPVFCATFDDARAQWTAYERARAAQREAESQRQVEPAAEQARNAEAALSRAIALYEEAGIAQAADLTMRMDYVRALETRGDFDLAAAFLEKTIALSPGSAVLWRHFGEAASRGGAAWRKRACPALLKALSLDSVSLEAGAAHVALADLYFDEALYDAARQHFDAALTLKADSVSARIGKSMLLAREGQLEEASRILDELGNAAQEYDTIIRTRLRIVLADCEKWGRYEDTAAYHRAYAKLAYRAGRPLDALLAGERVLRLDSSDVATINFLAAIHGQIGNLAQAQAAYRKSLEIQPEQPGIREALQRVEEAIAASAQNAPGAAPASK